VERTLLDADEITWLNAYHAPVAERVGPLVSGDAWHWLQARTRAI
jgi:Xaa-Pro aminopeptidase